MDNLDRLQSQLRWVIFAVLLGGNLLLLFIWWLVFENLELPSDQALVISLIGAVIVSLVLATVSSRLGLEPVKSIWQAVLHVNSKDQAVAAPRTDDLRLGRELVTGLVSQIYQLADVSSRLASETERQQRGLDHNFIAKNLPLPLIVLDADETITYANGAATNYLGSKQDELIGKSVYTALDMSFASQETFDKWLKATKNHNATAHNTWERVKLNIGANHPALLFDLAVYYNKDNPDKTETILVLFDHTKQYSQDDQAVNFIALTVHELRTPLTLLRGYIEVLEDELTGNIDSELQDFIEKMRAQADQLMAFVNNILNVTRVDDDQLELQLQEESWPGVLKQAIEGLSLRAKVRGITLHYQIATDLPTVGIDRLSILEVINNLVDNAIKYSAESKVINIDTHLGQDGLVETTIQDFGLGIPTSILPHLFTKFYRDHRNRAQIGGTGLGLYLSKAIVSAHGGNLWVRSQEGKGSTFGFTVVPYSQIAAELKQTGDKEIVRGAHGWIKNHSLYRR